MCNNLVHWLQLEQILTSKCWQENSNWIQLDHSSLSWILSLDQSQDWLFDVHKFTQCVSFVRSFHSFPLSHHKPFATYKPFRCTLNGLGAGVRQACREPAPISSTFELKLGQDMEKFGQFDWREKRKAKKKQVNGVKSAPYGYVNTQPWSPPATVPGLQ